MHGKKYMYARCSQCSCMLKYKLSDESDEYNLKSYTNIHRHTCNKKQIIDN